MFPPCLDQNNVVTFKKSYNRLLNNQSQCRLGKFLLLRCFYLSFLLSFNLQLAQSKVWSVDQSNGLQNKWANISWLQKMSQNDKMEFLVRCPMTSSSGICLKKKRKRKKTLNVLSWTILTKSVLVFRRTKEKLLTHR